jgi:hypothetical protein
MGNFFWGRLQPSSDEVTNDANSGTGSGLLIATIGPQFEQKGGQDLFTEYSYFLDSHGDHYLSSLMSSLYVKFLMFLPWPIIRSQRHAMLPEISCENLLH